MEDVKAERMQQISQIVQEVSDRVTNVKDLLTTLRNQTVRVVSADEEVVPDVTEILSQLREAGVDLTDPLVALALPREAFIEFAFWTRQPEFEGAAAGLLRGDKGYVEVLRDGLWNRITTWLDDFDVVGTERSVEGTRVAVGEIHIPHIDGCIGTFATTRSGALDVSIKVAGLRGGRSKKITLGSEIPVPAVCRAMTTGIGYEVTVKRHRFNGSLIALCKILWIDGTLIDEDLDPQAPHPCADNYPAAKAKIPSIAKAAKLTEGTDYADHPLAASVSEFPTYKLTLDLGTLYSASLSTPAMTVQSLPVPQIELAVESAVTRTVEMTWKLVKGHNYMRFRSERQDMRIFWAWM